MEEKNKSRFDGKKALIFLLIFSFLCLVVAIPVTAWFYKKSLAAYAPISSHEFLYIGGGHIEIDPITDDFVDADQENERFLFLDGIDATDGETYKDYVFCIYGRALSGFKLQLAYTTNNQFTYELYYAVESNLNSAGAVPYTTHGETPTTYYYTVDTDPARDDPIPGTYLNSYVDPVSGETLGTRINDPVTGNDKTYDVYFSAANVDKYAVPIYWQSNTAIQGDRDAFVNYFILRVWKNGKDQNDRETDVICIAAKSAAYISSPEP